MQRSARRAAGFTLIEILVAFAVATLLLGALYRVFSTGLRTAVTAENLSDAVLVAQSTLDATAGIAPRVSEADDKIDGYVRHVSIRLRPDLSFGSKQTQLVQYEVEVTVSWRDGRRERHVTLATLQPGPPPEAKQ